MIPPFPSSPGPSSQTHDETNALHIYPTSPSANPCSTVSRSIESSVTIGATSSQFVGDDLTGAERQWKNRYKFLLQKGYQLRERYKPDWVPSWTKNGKSPWRCEDGIFLILPMIIDAERTLDKLHVCIKLIRKESEEVEIAQFLSSERLRAHRNNHCVPVLDAFRDDISPEIQYLVTPVLRPFNDPDFGTAFEIMDFISQILEGLVFLHNNLIAHGDATGPNIMMDARPILPDGWHFSAYYCGPDGFEPLRPLSRLEHPVRYMFIDFGFSHRYLPGESPLVSEAGGRDSDVPELYTKGPYDLFKIDVFTIGNMFEKDLIEMYEGLEFIRPLTSFMKNPNPRNRPTAEESLSLWNSIKKQFPGSRWRLQRRSETAGERVVLNTIDVAKQGFHQITRLFKDDSNIPK